MMTELTTSGCNAHIVRLPQNQLLTYFDPRGGGDFVNCLIFCEKNNVCVAPLLGSLLTS